MQDKLIGYLVDALDPAEQRRFEAALLGDADLRRQLRLARHCLRPLTCDCEDFEPPVGLVESTCQYVAGSVALRRPPHHELAGAATPWSRADLVIAAGILVAAVLLLFPAMTNSRHHARLAGCQNNLRQIGQKLIAYSEGARGYFPQVPVQGKLAVAGMYAPTLKHAGLVTDDRVFLCPASMQDATRFCIPQLRDLEDASGPALRDMYRRMGGSFGYNLGYVVDGQLTAVKNLGRSHYPLMSDAPMRLQQAPLSSRNHGRQGQNVLFENGNVRQISSQSDVWNADDIYLNDAGRVGAGLHAADAVIGDSTASPLPAVRVDP